MFTNISAETKATEELTEKIDSKANNKSVT